MSLTFKRADSSTEPGSMNQPEHCLSFIQTESAFEWDTDTNWNELNGWSSKKYLKKKEEEKNKGTRAKDT